MDFQKVNLYDASIKPKHRINYELKGKNKFINRQISMKCADFFEATLTCANINNINFQKSIFIDSIMVDARFHHCNFTKANFNGADMKLVRFDNCNLEEANFKGALNIETIKYELGEEKKDGYCCYKGDSFLQLIDKDGKFVGTPQKEHYELPQDEISVFVSKLGVMDTQQLERYNRVMDFLNKKYKIKIVKIDMKDYRDKLQLDDIVTKMQRCSGVIIFAFSYMSVIKGTIHKNIYGKYKQDINDKDYTSPWLQIETAIARSRGLPCLIIHAPEIVKDGIFDERIVKDDDHLFSMSYEDPFPVHEAKIEDWYRGVKNTKQIEKKGEELRDCNEL